MKAIEQYFQVVLFVLQNKIFPLGAKGLNDTMFMGLGCFVELLHNSFLHETISYIDKLGILHHPAE